MLKRLISLTMLMLLMLLASSLSAPAAWAGKLLDEIKVADTCGATYADKLSSCTPFRCQKPNLMAMIPPTEDELKKIPPEKQREIRASMVAAEKKLSSMSAKKRAAMKAKMVSFLEIKGADEQGLCQVTASAIPGQRLDCTFNKALLAKVVDYTKLVATADSIESNSTTHFVNGQAVTQQIVTIDGKEMSDPWQEALDKGQCKLIETAPSPNSSSKGSTNTEPKKVSTAKQETNKLFILDASGSMWGQIKGKPKITIAKEVMVKLVPELPDNARIGLIAYGHRRKGDCNDVETLVKLGTNDKQAVLDAVKSLNAKGKTPLTRSVNRAFEMLQNEKDSSTIILVSDGIESCDADPCATVKAAKKYGVQFILHTIGFGLSKDKTDQLQCMAKAGGGQYFAANDAQELLESTRKALKSKGPGHFKLTLRSNGKPVKAWVKLSSESAGLVELTNDAGIESGHLWSLQPGTYQLETKPAGLQGVDPMVAKGLQIESGKTLEKQLDFEQAVLRITATNNGKPAVVQINVINLQTRQSVFNTASFSTFTMNGVKTPFEIKLKPGRYRLEVRLPTQSDLAPYREEIDLSKADKTLNKSIDLETVVLRVSATQAGIPAKARIFVDDLDAKRNIFNSDFLITGGFKTPYDVILTPGRYRLSVSPEQGVPNPWREELDIPSGSRVVEKQIRFDEKPTPKIIASMELDTDRPGGGDYRHVKPGRDDPAICQQACQDDENCHAWTYVKPNTIQGSAPNCWLKTSVPLAVPNSCCVSGVK